MAKNRPNVLWLMSDQHHAECSGYMNHPNVKTPNLDRIAAGGVNFTRGFANNPICSPSRICFMTGQYMHTHRMFGNCHAEYPEPEPDSLACLFRRYGYQNALIGKSHMVRKWDEEGFEHIRYTDLCDAEHGDPLTTHYFKYLDELGLADCYEEGTPKPGQEFTLDGSGTAILPYEHSIEHYTGEETRKFIKERDASRPFFIHMSFQRPHSPIAPSAEHFAMYKPEDIELPENAADFLENKFKGKPRFMVDKLKNGCDYPMADENPERLKKCLASYYALISVIDREIGATLDLLEKEGELDNTIIFYTADHGDFAGEHGLFHKCLGIYEPIHRIPYLLSWPNGLKGQVCDRIVESVDFYPTLCELCDVPLPEGRDGVSLLPIVKGESSGKDAAFCEWEQMPGPHRISAVRTDRFRLVFYQNSDDGELYDLSSDPGEMINLFHDSAYSDVKTDMFKRLLDFTLGYQVKTGSSFDMKEIKKNRYSPRDLLHQHTRYWSQLKKTYFEETSWPPTGS